MYYDRYLQWDIATKAMTLLKNDNNMLPLNNTDDNVLILVSNEYRLPAVVLCTVFGESSPQGTLPVNIPNPGNPEEILFERGMGLSY